MSDQELDEFVRKHGTPQPKTGDAIEQTGVAGDMAFSGGINTVTINVTTDGATQASAHTPPFEERNFAVEDRYIREHQFLILAEAVQDWFQRLFGAADDDATQSARTEHQLRYGNRPGDQLNVVLDLLIRLFLLILVIGMVVLVLWEGAR